MFRKILTLSAFLLFVIQAEAKANEPDFYLDFSTCKILIGYQESIKVGEGETLSMACYRISRKVSCTFLFDEGVEGVKGNKEEYDVTLDGAGFLYFGTEDGTSFFAAQPSKHTVTSITRMVDEGFAGSKVCQGMYITADELEAMPDK